MPEPVVVHQADPYTRQYPICRSRDTWGTLNIDMVTCPDCIAVRERFIAEQKEKWDKRTNA